MKDVTIGDWVLTFRLTSTNSATLVDNEIVKAVENVLERGEIAGYGLNNIKVCFYNEPKPHEIHAVKMKLLEFM